MMASHTTLEMKFLELEGATQTPKNTSPKIQKVPEYIRKRENFDREYSPMSVSIGPIHHHNKNLKLGENYKLTCAAKYIENTEHTTQFLHQKIADNISVLKDLFNDDVLALANTAESLKGFLSLEEKLSWLLFVDGCFLLYILDSMGRTHQDDVTIPMDLIFLVTKDMLLLENQLPYLVLKLLWKNDNEKELIETMKNFLNRCSWASKDYITKGMEEKLLNEPPIHLLDLQRKLILLTESNPKTKKLSREYPKPLNEMMFMNIEDLTAIGVKLKSSGTRSPKDVDFSEGWFSAELTLPLIPVNDATTSSFLNLIAYEMCPDFKNDYGICSFVAFMDSLIDHAEDVKKLRSKGIVWTYHVRDEEVAGFFNNISTDLIINPTHYFEVLIELSKHRFSKHKVWLAQGYHTYFSTPWAMIGFIAAVIALVLTFFQTWFTIFPR